MNNSIKVLAVMALAVGAGHAGAAVPEIENCRASFSFRYRDTEFRGVPEGWKRETRKSETEDGRTLSLTRAVEPDTGFALVLEETRYRDLPVYEWEVSFENRGAADSGRLTRLSSVDWDVPVALPGAKLWEGVGETWSDSADRNYSFTRSEIKEGFERKWESCEGYPCYFCFPYFRVYDDRGGYTVALGYQGQWEGRLQCRGGSVNLRAGQQTVDFYLKPGERVIAPKITVLRFRDADDAVNGWRRFMRERILPRDKDGKRPIRPILAGGGHEGGCLFIRTTEAGQLAAVRRFAAEGVFCDTWWIDAGWYTRTSKLTQQQLDDPLVWYRSSGDWTPDPERLPDGFRRVAEEQAKHGGTLTLWHEPERIHETSAFLPKARPYLVKEPIFESYRYDLTRPDVVKFLAGTIADSLDRNAVGIYRQDSNGAGPLQYWQSREKELGDGRHGFVENQAVQGQFAFWNELRRRRPSLLFDACASGGRRNDLSTLRFPALPLHYTDIGWEDSVAQQRHGHMLNEWLFYRKNISNFFHSKGKLQRRAAVVQLAPFYHIDSAVFFAGDLEAEKKYLDCWRRLAALMIDGDYYLLTSEEFGADRWWVTEFYDPAKGEGFLQVVRNPAAKAESVNVVLRGLRAGEKFACEDLYGGRRFEYTAGAEMTLSLPADDATFVRFTRQ